MQKKNWVEFAPINFSLVGHNDWPRCWHLNNLSPSMGQFYMFNLSGARKKLTFNVGCGGLTLYTKP